LFEPLTSQLRNDVETVQKALHISEGLRSILVSESAILSILPAQVPEGADDNTRVVHQLAQLLPGVPDKLDWQIYDHCAALTRLYSIYEQFVGELVSKYVTVLPNLYPKYLDLPQSLITQHRSGIGQILLKMGEKGRYKKLEEAVVVRELAAAVAGASTYKLLADAFFVERQNLRYEVLCRILSTLGFEHAGRFINKHAAVLKFIKEERADNSSAQKELEAFIDYRNEAAHKGVVNLLGIDEIGRIGGFIIALATALADLVERAVLHRRMELGHYASVMPINEVHHSGFVVIGTPGTGIRISAGDEVLVFNQNGTYRANVETLQINGDGFESVICDGVTELGIRLSTPASWGAELRRLQIPGEGSVEVQLQLENTILAPADVADTDIGEAVESREEEEHDQEEQDEQEEEREGEEELEDEEDLEDEDFEAVDDEEPKSADESS